MNFHYFLLGGVTVLFFSCASMGRAEEQTTITKTTDVEQKGEVRFSSAYTYAPFGVYLESPVLEGEYTFPLSDSFGVYTSLAIPVARDQETDENSQAELAGSLEYTRGPATVGVGAVFYEGDRTDYDLYAELSKEPYFANAEWLHGRTDAVSVGAGFTNEIGKSDVHANFAVYYVMPEKHGVDHDLEDEYVVVAPSLDVPLSWTGVSFLRNTYLRFSPMWVEDEGVHFSLALVRPLY